MDQELWKSRYGLSSQGESAPSLSTAFSSDDTFASVMDELHGDPSL
jgi:hypothetical protein